MVTRKLTLPPFDSKDPASFHEAQVRILLTNAELLTQQMAEVVTSHHLAQAASNSRDARMAELEAAMRKNTAITEEVSAMLTPLKGLIKTVGWLGTAIKWLGMIAAAFISVYTAVYVATHDGNYPKLK